MLSEPVDLPEYVSLSPHDQGAFFDLPAPDWRRLVSTSLAICHSLPDEATMGIYRHASVVCLDIWSEGVGCLTIAISSPSKQLQLLLAPLDSPSAPQLLFAGSTSPEDWQQLKQHALSA